MELTQEVFERILSEKLETQSRDLKAHAEELQAELARMVNDGFENMQSRLDVTDRVVKLEHTVQEIRAALHLSS